MTVVTIGHQIPLAINSVLSDARAVQVLREVGEHRRALMSCAEQAYQD